MFVPALACRASRTRSGNRCAAAQRARGFDGIALDAPWRRPCRLAAAAAVSAAVVTLRASAASERGRADDVPVRVLQALTNLQGERFIAVGTEREAIFVPVSPTSHHEQHLFDCLDCLLRADSATPRALPRLSPLALGSLLYARRTLLDELPFEDRAHKQACCTRAMRPHRHNALEYVCSVMDAAQMGVLACRIAEAASLRRQARVSGSVQVRFKQRQPQGARSDGAARDGAFTAPCAAVEAVCMSAATRAPLGVESTVWSTFSAAYERGTDGRVRLPFEYSLPAWHPDSASAADDGSTPDLAYVTADALDAMGAEELRAALRRYRVATKPSTPPSDLRDLALPFMDEVERREFRIMQCVARQQFEQTKRLVDARSRRGALLEQLRVALNEERFEDAARLRDRIVLRKRQRADWTQDEGAYDRNLDQDEWYRPNR